MNHNVNGKMRQMNLQQIIKKRHFIMEKSQRYKKNTQILDESKKFQNQSVSTIIEDFLNSGIQNSQSSKFSNLRESSEGKSIVKKLQKQKLKNLAKFNIFTSLEKNLQNYISYFEQFEYSKEDIIYNINQEAKGVYFIIEGQVIASVLCQNNGEEQSQCVVFNSFKRKKKIFKRIDLFKLSQGNIFGQKQIFYQKQSLRTESFRCYSAKCVLMFVNKQNFYKICTKNQEFYKKIKNDFEIKYLIHKKSQMQLTSTLKKIQYNKKKYFNEQNAQTQLSVRSKQNKSLSVSILKKRKLTIMHGKQIKSYSDLKIKKNSSIQEQNYFGYKMLQADQQLYKQTQKKFRKYSYLRKNPKLIKTQSDQLGVQNTRSLKTLWNLLNLDAIVDEQTKNYATQQGKKYFYISQKYKRHISETRSIKPFSSMNYLKKANLKYI